MIFEELLPKTQAGIRAYCRDNGCEELLKWEETGLSILWFRLRAAEDRPDWFPSGKWATLQAMCVMLEIWSNAQTTVR